MRKPKGIMKNRRSPTEPAGMDGAPTAAGTEEVAPRPAAGIEEPSPQVQAERLEALEALLGLMRPAVQADGGDLVLVSADVVGGRVEVMLQGSCSSCAISSTTLQAGVERILHDRLDWVTEVLGRVDESLSLDDSMAMGQGGYVPKF
ncbi:MAG: NifU family protein [Acidimicrobiales bacterium]